MVRLERFRLCVFMGLGLLTVRLGHLQLLQGRHYLELAEQNRLRLIPDPAPRGLIVDRRGRVMAGNQTVYRIALVPQELESLEPVLTRLSAVSRRAVPELASIYRAERTLAFLPVTVVPRVTKEVALGLEETRWRFPGLLVKPETTRAYPLGSTASHLLGYLSEPLAEEMPLLKPYGVRPKERIGRRGIERLLDHALRGRSGGVLVEVNHRGRQVRVIGRREPQAGATVALTVDAQLQSLIEQSFGAQPGAAVVLDPETGAVLAMVSRPGFDPGVFMGGDAAGIQRLLDDPLSPFMNRAAVGAYQPGSTAKLMTAAAALEQHVITPETIIDCPGSLKIGDRTFHCWNRDGHGPMTLTEALMQSCNVYFMQVGRRLGEERLRSAMAHIGFSRLTGWPLEEVTGHLPMRRLSEGEVALLAIGQGEILVTPLQGALMAAAFANRGWLVEPWVISSVGGRPVQARHARRRLGWSPATIEAVRQGMQAVVQRPDGTGHRAFSPHIPVAGKTGTAQTHIPGRTHGWFVGFCPVDKPRAAMGIVAEFGGSGGELPAEIGRTVCEYLDVTSRQE